MENEVQMAMNKLSEWMEPIYTPGPFLIFPSSSEYRYEPYGVTLIIGPYNYPLILTVSPSSLNLRSHLLLFYTIHSCVR